MSYQKTGFDGNPIDPNRVNPTENFSAMGAVRDFMKTQSQVIGSKGYEYVDAATRPKSSGGGGLLGDIGNAVSNAGSAITQTVKPVADKITPNTDQLNLTPNLNQDLTKIDVGSPNFDQKINTPTLNTDQDLTKISVRGLQESAVEQAGDAQNSLIQTGTGIQAGAVNIGKAGQEALVKLGSDAQEQAVKSGTQISGGQSNATLEGYANQATKGTESQINQVTTYVEDKVIPVVNDAVKFHTEDFPAVKLAQGAVYEFEKLTPSIEMLGSFDLAGGGSVQDTSDPMPNATLDANAPNLGDDKVFSDLETATGKGSQMSEEERLRRIRRLLTNRYGREKTILGGAGDTTSRRRYAV